MVVVDHCHQPQYNVVDIHNTQNFELFKYLFKVGIFLFIYIKIKRRTRYFIFPIGFA